MSRYIDADKLIESECQYSCGEIRCEDGKECDQVRCYKSLIITADMVEVVRCKNCKWFEGNEVGTWCNATLRHTLLDGYCNRGKRKDGAE